MGARERVEAAYPVVGVVELWEETMEVLEDIIMIIIMVILSMEVLEDTLPFFFKGAAEMFAKKRKEVSIEEDCLSKVQNTTIY